MTRGQYVGDYATMTGGSALVIQRWLPGPAERVWQYLTDSGLREKWLASGEMELAIGAPLELVWRNDTLSEPGDLRPADLPEVQRLQSQILAFDRARLLKIAWGSGDVTFDLKEKGDRVLLTVTHRGIGDREAQMSMAGGWHMHLDILSSIRLDTKPPSFWSGWRMLTKDYANRLEHPKQE